MKNLTFWTIQSLSWYENLLKDKVIHTDKSKIDEEFYFEYAYQWLSKQMIDKMGKPTWENQSMDLLPLWAWYQYEGNKKRPDLRCSGHLEKGTKGVRIEFTKPASQVLLSDFGLWHSVLNNWYLPETEEQDKAFDSLLNARGIDYPYDPKNNPDDIQAMIENSWLKVLDLDYYSDYSSFPIEQKSIQANFWDLSIDEIIKVDKFVAR